MSIFYLGNKFYPNLKQENRETRVFLNLGSNDLLGQHNGCPPYISTQYNNKSVYDVHMKHCTESTRDESSTTEDLESGNPTTEPPTVAGEQVSYKCAVSSKTLASSEYLSRHMARKHGSKPKIARAAQKIK